MSKTENTDIKDNISSLQNNINTLLNEIDDTSAAVFKDSTDILPDINIDKVDIHDYEKDLEMIKLDSKETLNCLANLYLDETIMKNKNISNIIKDDALRMADLNFSIACSKKALIQCMRQIDFCTTNAEIFMAIPMFQKELRESIKAAHEILHIKMKEFYKSLKEEIKETEINAGKPETDADKNNLNIISSPKQLNDILSPEKIKELMKEYKDDPTFLNREEDDRNKKTEL
jgi:hypothetical protein